MNSLVVVPHQYYSKYMDIKFNMDIQDREKILALIMRQVAPLFKAYMKEKSLSPKQFYAGLSNTVEENDSKIMASGLTRYILDKRPYLPWDFVEYLSEKMPEMNVRIQ